MFQFILVISKLRVRIHLDQKSGTGFLRKKYVKMFLIFAFESTQYLLKIGEIVDR
jgi:hypothetical protein